MLLSVGELTSSRWRLSDSLGTIISTSLVFGTDGAVELGGVLHHWALTDVALTVTAERAEVAIFTRWQTVDRGMRRLCGRATDPAKDLLYYFLEPEDQRSPTQESRINMTGSLSMEADTLLITINSAGRFSEGFDTRWEFYQLPLEHGLDHVRIAETRSPTFYYLDKVETLREGLAGLIGPRYKLVILVGISSGAFMAILLAELLARDRVETEFRSAGINPQTGHSRRHRSFIASNTPLGTAPELLTDEVVSTCDPRYIDIATVVLRDDSPRQNVGHTIFYDSDNLCENYYVSLIAELPGFDLRPIPLGRPHYESCGIIYYSNAVHEFVLSLVRRRNGPA